MQRITKEKLKELLENRHTSNPYKKLSNLPSPSLLIDNVKAAQRVKKAIENKEKIVIVGDYDVDGIISTTIITMFFKLIGYEVESIIPNRFKHGYGLSPKIVENLEANLVITVDNGISSIEASKVLKSKNIDLIITDHHTVGSELPFAYAIVNPKRVECTFPFKDICGAQVAWYLCAAIKKELGLNIDLTYFFDLLSIAIIADIMPMTSLNYTMVKSGMNKLVNSDKPAMELLNKIMSKKCLNSDDVGFFIAPIINSAGRLDDGSIALSFLLSKSLEEASVYFDELQALNNTRKTLQEEITKKATYEVKDEDKVIVVWGENWHEGVIGIVASKLSNKFKRPAFVFSVEGEKAKGSARSSGSLNLYDLINESKDLLLGFGGHKNAAGLAIESEKLEQFKESINNSKLLEDFSLHHDSKSIGEIDPYSIDLELANLIDMYEPYGLKNKRPIFELINTKVINYSLIGKEKNHLKLQLNSCGVILEAIYFNYEFDLSDLKNSLDLTISICKNEFRGEEKAQILVQKLCFNES